MKAHADLLNEARGRWYAASDEASKIAHEIFKPGCGYGDPEGLKEELHKMQVAKDEAERLFREYQDLQKNYLEGELLRNNRSQRIVTWASFTVAAVVGIATVINVILEVL